jgi:DNA-directed RNA polymerase subunit RPC12/RpoP
MSDRLRVEPLRCEKCGAPVPVPVLVHVVDDEKEAKCRACGSKWPIPEAIVELRAAARREKSTRESAKVLADELAAPPNLFMRVWMTASAITSVLVAITLVVWLIVGLIMCIGMIWKEGIAAAVIAIIVGLILAVPLVYNEILHDLARPLGVDYADTLSNATSYALLGLSFFVLLAVPTILGQYAEGFEAVRTTLRKVLSAKAPSIEGGPAECRECGAALEVTEGSLHARCIYCSTDNLVDVPTELVTLAGKDADTKARDFEAAKKETAKARIDGKRAAMKKTAKAFAWLVPGFMLLGFIVAALNEERRFYFKQARTDQGPQTLIAKIDTNPPLIEGTPSPFQVNKPTIYDRCHVDACEAYYFVALDKGDRFDAHVDDSKALRLVRIEERIIGKWYNPTYTWQELEGAVAPYRGWYRVVLSTPQKAKGAPNVTWTRTRSMH